LKKYRLRANANFGESVGLPGGAADKDATTHQQVDRIHFVYATTIEDGPAKTL
jgi:hypothetical protein